MFCLPNTVTGSSQIFDVTNAEVQKCSINICEMPSVELRETRQKPGAAGFNQGLDKPTAVWKTFVVAVNSRVCV